ncbi:hypothetical protein J6590_105703, partial [Homalodisca vitripennis]
PLWNGGHKTTREGLPSVDGEVVVHTDSYTVQPPCDVSVLSLYKIAQVITFYYMGGQTLTAAMETDAPLWNGGHKTTGEGLPNVDGEVVVHTDTYTVQPRRRVELQAKVEDLKRIT